MSCFMLFLVMANSTGIIPFSYLRVFYANIGLVEIFFATRKGVLKTNGKQENRSPE